MQTSAIISKHFNIKVLQTFLVTLSTLFGILMISRLTGYFEKASRGELELSNIFFVVLLRLPDFLSFLIPFSIFVSLIIVISRKFQNNEIYAVYNLGVSPIRHALFLWKQIILVILIVGLLSIFIGPYAKSISETYFNDQTAKDYFGAFEPNKINKIPNSNSFIFFDEEADNTFKDVIFISDDASALTIIESRLLEYKYSDNKIDLSFKNGKFFPNLNTSSIVSINFQNFDHSVSVVTSTPARFTFKKVFDLDGGIAFIDMQWRISFVVMTIILIFLGFNLGKVKARSSSSSNILSGLFIYISYLASLILYRDSYAGINQFFYIGLWPIHLIFLTFTLSLIFRDFRNSLFQKIHSKNLLALLVFMMIVIFMWIFLE